MSLPRPRLNFCDPENKRIFDFLNQVIKPVSNNQMKSNDIKSFFNLISISAVRGGGHLSLQTLKETNPDILIRLFFPTIQLPQPLVEFLTEAVIVFRSEIGFYDYPQFNAGVRELKTCHEVRMGFLEIYLMVNFGLNFRHTNIENQNNIGVWNRDLSDSLSINTNATYEIEILPPRNTNLFKTLKCVAHLQTFADAFALPQLEQSPHRLVNLEKLENTFKSAFKTLEYNLTQVIENTFTQLSKLHAPENSKDEAKLEDIDAVTKASASIAKLRSPFQEMFTLRAHTIQLNEIIGHSKLQKDFFNYIALYFLLLLGKEQLHQATALASETKYNGQQPIRENNSLQAWLYKFLRVECSKDLDALQTIAYGNYQTLTKNYIDSHILLSTNSLTIPAELFNKILTEKNIALINSVDPHAIKLATEQLDSYKDQTTKFLLTELLNTKKSLHSSIFIRKIHNKKDTTESLAKQSIQRDFHCDTNVDYMLTVRPATFVVPGIPIATYQRANANSSGVIIITPPDNAVPMVSYKRAAYDLSEKPSHPFGFPYQIENAMRVHGGKPSYSMEEFFQRIMAIELRAEGKLKDMPRKEFFRHYFNEIISEALSFSEILNRVLDFSGEEKQAFLSDCVIAIEPGSDYGTYLELVDDIKRKLRHLPIEVTNHYLSRFKSIVNEAIAKQQSIKDILSDHENRSLITRVKRFEDNKNSYGIGHLPTQHIHAIAAPGIRYYRHHNSIKHHHSNETLLQGIRPIHNAFDNTAMYPLMNDNWDAALIIKHQLLTRYGNYTAVYANTTSPAGIQDAIKIHLYYKSTYGKSLPFVTYDETSFNFAVYTKDEFMQFNSAASHQQMSLSDANEMPSLEPQYPISGASSSSPLPPVHPAPSGPSAPADEAMTDALMQLSQTVPSVHKNRKRKANKISIDLTYDGNTTETDSVPDDIYFKKTAEYKQNLQDLVKQAGDYGVYFRQTLEILGTDFMEHYNGNFTCNFRLKLTISRKKTELSISSSKRYEYKCIDGTMVFSNIKHKEFGVTERTRALLHQLNADNYNPKNQPLTSSSFKLTSAVSDIKVTPRPREDLHFEKSSTNFILYKNFHLSSYPKNETNVFEYRQWVHGFKDYESRLYKGVKVSISRCSPVPLPRVSTSAHTVFAWPIAQQSSSASSNSRAILPPPSRWGQRR